MWTGQVPTRCGWCGKNSMYQSIAWPMHFCCANCHPGIENDPRWRFPGKTNVAGEFVPRPE